MVLKKKKWGNLPFMYTAVNKISASELRRVYFKFIWSISQSPQENGKFTYSDNLVFFWCIWILCCNFRGKVKLAKKSVQRIKVEIASKYQYLACNGIVLSSNAEVNSSVKCEFERIFSNSFSTERRFTITHFVYLVVF